MTPTPAVSTERSLIRTIASAARKLDKDMDLSPLQAIDRLQRLHTQFKEEWVGPSSPWLVCEDGFCLPPNMSVQTMLDNMGKHGAAIGLVGVGMLKESGRLAVLQMMFRKDAKSLKTVEKSSQAAHKTALAALMAVDLLSAEK